MKKMTFFRLITLVAVAFNNYDANSINGQNTEEAAAYIKKVTVLQKLLLI